MTKTYCRATFRGWIPRPGEIQLNFNAPVEVEIFPETKERWKVRARPGRGVYAGIEGAPAYCQALIAERFREQVSAWTWYDAKGNLIPEPETDPFTHLAGDASLQPLVGTHLIYTVCKRTVLKTRLSTPPTARPSCPTCYEVWKTKGKIE